MMTLSVEEKGVEQCGAAWFCQLPLEETSPCKLIINSYLTSFFCCTSFFANINSTNWKEFLYSSHICLMVLFLYSGSPLSSPHSHLPATPQPARMDLNPTFHTHPCPRTPLKIKLTPTTSRIMGTGKCTAHASIWHV
jgi:hypothetical protein